MCAKCGPDLSGESRGCSKCKEEEKKIDLLCRLCSLHLFESISHKCGTHSDKLLSHYLANNSAIEFYHNFHLDTDFEFSFIHSSIMLHLFPTRLSWPGV